MLADGTVEINTHSPAYYLNQNFYANVNVPPSASPAAIPQWTIVDRTGQLEWHDHRIHWMSPALPPQVKDRSKRTKIFDWQVPIQVGASRGAVNGELFWTPESGTKAPAGAIVALVVIAAAWPPLRAVPSPPCAPAASAGPAREAAQPPVSIVTR